MPDLTLTSAVDTFLGSADQAAMRTNLGLGTMATEAVSGLNLTGAATLTRTSLGATRNNGLSLINSTAAAAGAQQASPALSFKAFGWKTNATAASQAVDFHAWLLPVQGAANPTGLLKFTSSVNGGADFDAFCIDSRGFVIVPDIGASTPNISGDSGGTCGLCVSNGQIYFKSYGSVAVGIYNGGIQTTGVLAFNASAVGGTQDVIIQRDAAGILAQKNGSNAQKHRVYGTTTGNKYIQIEHDGTNAKITASSGSLLLSDLPTSNPGPGILWNNAGTPAIGT